MSQNEGLCEAAMDRAIAALELCAAKMRRNGVDRCRSVATEACRRAANCDGFLRSAEHTSELHSLMRISYAVFCLRKKIHKKHEYPDVARRATLQLHTVTIT